VKENARAVALDAPAFRIVLCNITRTGVRPMSSRESEAARIFLEAVEHHECGQRADFVREAAAGDPLLFQRVDELLKAHGEPNHMLDGDRLVPTGDIPQPRERPGTVIGPYKLLEQIGEGGFGVVFLAEQTQPVRRKVALKILKPGMDTRQVVARFEAERQALAIMDHPNIAHVFDGGETASGRPYFVMELVKGAPITEFSDQNHLTPRQRLDLFVSVCQAVQHAHQKGVIHRDLKPSNVLVTRQDGAPTAKVIDFGIAKALGQQLTEKTLHTSLAQMIGTPLYMSPEQAQQGGLDIDTRSDVYSLGVVLYELLTGATPFDAERLRRAPCDEMCRILREEEPPRPSTRVSTLGRAGSAAAAQRHMEPAKLTKLVRGDLDSIVMRALEKDRNRRYETANAFAADVQRYLNDETVQACPPSAWYRFRKFARRNRGPLTMASVVTAALALVVAVLAGSVGWVVRDRDARRATTAEQVSLSLNEAFLLQEQQKWPEALAAVKRAEAVLANGIGDAELHNRVQELGKDLEMVAKLDDLRIQKTLEDGGFVVANTRADIADARAFEAYGIDVLTDAPEHVAASIQARSIRGQLVAALDDWMLVQSDAGVRERLRAIVERVDPDTCRKRMRQAVVANDRRALEELAARPEVANFPPASGYLLAQALSNAGAGPSAVQVLSAVQQRHPQDFWLNYQLGIQFLWGPGVQHNPNHAAGYFRAALVARQDVERVYFYLGLALPGLEHVDEVISLNRKAIEVAQSVGRTYSVAHNNLGGALRLQGKFREAEAEYRKALHLRPNLPEAAYNLALTLHNQGKLAEAEAAYREALRLQPDFFNTHLNLGCVLFTQGKPAEAEAECREALRLRPDFPDAHLNLGAALRRQGKPAEAEAEYREALRLRPNFPDAQLYLGIALGYQGKHGEAAAEYAAAFAVDPKLADDLPTQHRYNAACSAALSGCGQGNDAGKLDEKDRARLRRQALAWLRADLAAWGQLLEKEPAKTCATLQQTLRHWQQDADFTGVRGDALTKLPETERPSWQQLWAEVEQTLRKASPKDAKEKPAG
jgi:serine/threonine protein kinase/Tfp pilus assembly protein PilF